MIRKYLLKLEKSKKKDPKKVKQNVKCKIHIETKAQTVKKMQNPCRNRTPIAKKKKMQNPYEIKTSLAKRKKNKIQNRYRNNTSIARKCKPHIGTRPQLQNQRIEHPNKNI